jgi:hypothetical protein
MIITQAFAQTTPIPNSIWDQPGLSLSVILMMVFMVVMYLLPAIIGWRRGVSSRVLLLMLNVFFGWTVLGWLVFLIWAVTGATRAQDAFYRQQGKV